MPTNDTRALDAKEERMQLLGCKSGIVLENSFYAFPNKSAPAFSHLPIQQSDKAIVQLCNQNKSRVDFGVTNEVQVAAILTTPLNLIFHQEHVVQLTSKCASYSELK